MSNTTENNATERTEAQTSAKGRISDNNARLWGIEPTDRGYKVNAQMLIKRYIQSRPLAYAGNGIYYEYVKGVWVETDEVEIKKRLLLVVDHFVPYLLGKCGYSLNSSVSNLLPLLCRNLSKLTPATNFINLWLKCCIVFILQIWHWKLVKTVKTFQGFSLPPETLIYRN